MQGSKECGTESLDTWRWGGAGLETGDGEWEIGAWELEEMNEDCESSALFV